MYSNFSPNIAIVANTSWNIVNFRMALIRRLLELNCKVLVLAPEDDYTSIITEERIPFHPLKNLSRKGTNPFEDMALIKEIYTFYKEKSIDIGLHYTIKPNIYGSIAGYMSGTKTISTVTGLGYSFLNKGISNKMSRILYKLAFKKSTVVAFQNSDDKHLFISNGLSPEASSRLILGSGVDTDYFNPKEHTFGQEGKRCFIFVGRLLKDKGILEFLEAANAVAKKYPKAKFKIVGGYDSDNPASIPNAHLNTFLKNKQISYTEQTNNIKSFLEEADVFVLPSYREGLPKSTLEALSMAKPIISTNVAGCRETVNHQENGFLIPSKNHSELAAAMEKMLLLPEKDIEMMGLLSRKLAITKFSQEIIINQYIQIIQEILTKTNNLCKP